MTEHPNPNYFKNDRLYNHFERESREGKTIGKCDKCHLVAYPGLIPNQEVKFCTRCGGKLSFYRRIMSCSKDKSHLVEQSWTFCGICGSPVNEKEELIP